MNSGPTPPVRGRPCRSLFKRQVYGEGGSSVNSSLNKDAAAQFFHNRVYDGKPETVSQRGFAHLGGKTGLKDSGNELPAYAHAVVAHGEMDECPLFVLARTQYGLPLSDGAVQTRPDFNAPLFLLYCITGIYDEIEQYLHDTRFMGTEYEVLGNITFEVQLYVRRNGIQQQLLQFVENNRHRGIRFYHPTSRGEHKYLLY